MSDRDPRHRKQFDAARTAYDARNALGISNWNYVNNGSATSQLPTGNLTLKAGPGVTLSIIGSTVVIGVGGTPPPVTIETYYFVAGQY